MLLKRKYYLWLISFSFHVSGLFAQPAVVETHSPLPDQVTAFYTVGKIIITGNKKTKNEIIERELPFASGDQLTPAAMTEKMELARRQLMNTALFNHAVVAANDFENNTVNILVEVKERWYLFPVPYIKPVDRNINQWLFQQKASFDRVNYGAKFTYNNATGHRDKLKVWLINGYTKQVSFSYDRFYFDKKMKWGFNTSFAQGRNREINYNTIEDKQVFLKNPDSYVRRFVNGHIGLSYRPAINTRHSFGISFTSEEVQDTVVKLNPAYFNDERSSIAYPGIYYNLTWFDLDYIPYPTKGYAAQFSISKNGFNKSNNLWQLHIKGLANWRLSPKTFFHLNGQGGIKLPFKQPWFNRRFLGFGDTFMQGYEYNIIDGVAGGYLKTTLSRELLNFKARVPAGRNKPSLIVPFRIFGKVYGNTGYVYNPEQGDNLLSNKMLYSGGLGIDILTLYDVVIKLEWSFNQLGQNGLFLHRKTIF